MIIEFGGGEGGFKEYLETGQKKGRELHRDQLDQRIPLFGDLNVFEIATLSHEGEGKRYDHITLSFSENHISDEMLLKAVTEFREHALAAWHDDERHRVAFYAEAHRPKILSYVNSETGERIERLTHIHLGIGRRDLATGKAIEVLGFLGTKTDNLKYIDAFQELFNATHGFASPKDNPKITSENAVDTLARYTGARPDALGTFNQRKAALEIALQKEILARNITTWGDFEKLLEGHGAVSKMYKGQFNECFRVKPHNSDKAMRLAGIFFQRGFIERPTEEKLAIISRKAKVAYLEQMQPRKAPEYLEITLNEWRTTKAREHRYLHTGSKFYREIYKPADAKTRLHLLDQLERNHHAKPSSSANNRSKEITTTRNRLSSRMSIRNLDGIQLRTEMLLLYDNGLDVGAIPSEEQNSMGLRPADEREVGNDRRNGGEGVSQPSSVIAQVIAEQRERYMQAGDKDRYAEIHKNLDCVQLLSHLSHSHGLDPDLYQLKSAKDGTPRIQCGARALTPSDFLTKELGLLWKEAAPILRQVYEQQIRSEITKPRSRIAAPSQLWKAFKAEQKAGQLALAQQLKVFSGEAKARRADLSATLKSEQKNTLNGLSGSARKAAHSLEKFRAATAKSELADTLKEERQALREAMRPSQALAWQLYLQTRAQAGNEEALAALKKIDSSARTEQPSVPSITGTIVLDDEGERKRRRIRESAAEILKTMVRFVEVNGDVTYSRHGQAILRDEGRHLSILDESSEEAIAAGLLIAREKFGGNLSLTGSAEFQRRVVAVAVAQGIAVKFADPLTSNELQQQAERAAAPVAELPAAEQIQPKVVAVPSIPTPLLPADDWIAAHHKPVAHAYSTGDRKVVFTVAHVAADCVVIDHGMAVAKYPIPSGVVFHVGQQIIINKEGSVTLAPERLTPEAGKGGQGD